MKSFMNYSKLAFTALIATSCFVACSSDDDPAEYTAQYIANTASLKSAGEAVDLGLPSGTKWADRNVGASSATDNGILFIWGDITGSAMLPSSSAYSTNPLSAEKLFELYKGEEKVGYLYDTLNVYKEIAPADDAQLDELKKTMLEKLKTQYSGRLEATIQTDATNKKNYLVIDNLDSTAVKYFVSTKGDFKVGTGADIKDIPVDLIAGNASFDPATANWGANWSMPTREQIDELIKNCTWEFTGNGYKVTTKSTDAKVKGNSIFLPAAGYRYGETWIGNGNAGYYASGAIYGSFHFPSMTEQVGGSVGSVSGQDICPNVMIYQHGQFDNSVKIYNNLTSNFAFSVRPVTK